MLVADVNANPYFKELCDAAKEIAELKAQITKLEKIVDGVMAQHYAGQLSSSSADAQTEALETTYDSQDTFTDDDAFSGDTAEAIAEIGAIGSEDAHFEDTAPELASDDNVALDSAHQDPSDADQATETDTADDTSNIVPLHQNSLPSALRSLICQPTKSALTTGDDLTLIKGIDCVTALELAAHDLARFEDLANLDAAAVQDLRSSIDMAQNIHQQAWIEQAAILANGELTDYAQRTLDGRKPIQTDMVLETPSPEHMIDEDDFHFDLDMDVDYAERAVQQAAECSVPRIINIERPMTTVMCTDENSTPFWPMAAADAGFAVEKIPHQVARSPRDFGNTRALAASLAATAVIYVAATTGIVDLNVNMAQLMRADVCEMTGLASFPDTCRQLLNSVL